MAMITDEAPPAAPDEDPQTLRRVPHNTYSASKSYGSSAGGGVNDANRDLERIWFSPHCTVPGQGVLDFGGAA